MEKSLNKEQKKYLISAFGCSLYLILTTIGMFTYYRPYKFSDDFYSNIGLVRGTNGESNTIICILFTVAAITAGVLLIPLFTTLPIYFQSTKSQRISKIGMICSVISAIAYALIGASPADVASTAHFIGVAVAFLMSIPSIFFYILAMGLNKQFPRWIMYLFIIFLGILIAYPIVSILNADNNTVLVIAQKVIVISEMIVVIITGIGMKKFVDKGTYIIE